MSVQYNKSCKKSSYFKPTLEIVCWQNQKVVARERSFSDWTSLYYNSLGLMLTNPARLCRSSLIWNRSHHVLSKKARIFKTTWAQWFKNDNLTWKTEKKHWSDSARREEKKSKQIKFFHSVPATKSILKKNKLKNSYKTWSKLRDVKSGEVNSPLRRPSRFFQNS